MRAWRCTWTLPFRFHTSHALRLSFITLNSLAFNPRNETRLKQDLRWVWAVLWYVENDRDNILEMAFPYWPWCVVILHRNVMRDSTLKVLKLFYSIKTASLRSLSTRGHRKGNPLTTCRYEVGVGVHIVVYLSVCQSLYRLNEFVEKSLKTANYCYDRLEGDWCRSSQSIVWFVGSSEDLSCLILPA